MPRVAQTSCRMASEIPSSSRTLTNRVCPVSVTATPESPRESKVTPQEVSNCLTAWDTADWVIPSRPAAAVNPPSFATMTNISSWEKVKGAPQRHEHLLICT